VLSLAPLAFGDTHNNHYYSARDKDKNATEMDNRRESRISEDSFMLFGMKELNKKTHKGRSLSFSISAKHSDPHFQHLQITFIVAFLLFYLSCTDEHQVKLKLGY